MTQSSDEELVETNIFVLVMCGGKIGVSKDNDVGELSSEHFFVPNFADGEHHEPFEIFNIPFGFASKTATTWTHASEVAGEVARVRILITLFPREAEEPLVRVVDAIVNDAGGHTGVTGTLVDGFDHLAKHIVGQVLFTAEIFGVVRPPHLRLMGLRAWTAVESTRDHDCLCLRTLTWIQD